MFPGATTDRDAASYYVVVGAPLDATTTFQPGTRFGPDRIRRFAETYDDYDRRTDSDFSALGVCDAGDVRSWDDVKNILTTSLPNCEASPTTTPSPPRRRRAHRHARRRRSGRPRHARRLRRPPDLRDAYDGNPLSHACVTRRALDDLGVDRAVIVGARTGSEAEWDRAADADVTVVPRRCRAVDRRHRRGHV